MTDRLGQLLSNRPWLLADGATGTNLFACGLESGGAPELWNLEFPERIRGLQREFVAAGADIVLTNSFGGTRHRLKLHDAAGRVAEINGAAARLSRTVADEADRMVLVAGSMGPTGELFEPLGPVTMAEGTEAFSEQALALAQGGADLIWIETMSSGEELTAAVAGAGRTGLPIVCTLSFDTNGRTMMGVTPAQVAALAQGLTPRPAAYGANCGTGPAELVAVILSMSEAAGPGDVLVAKSNCGIPEFVNGAIRYSGTPELMAEYTKLAIDSGARIVGGCCGTTPEHLGAMRAALAGYSRGERPAFETIVDRLGQISKGARTLHTPDSCAPQRHPTRDRRRRRGRADSQLG